MWVIFTIFPVSRRQVSKRNNGNSDYVTKIIKAIEEKVLVFTSEAFLNVQIIINQNVALLAAVIKSKHDI